MDDLDWGGIMMGWVGLEANDASATEEKVGEDRLGSPNLFQSFGPTLLMGSIAFGFLLILVIVILIIVRQF